MEAVTIHEHGGIDKLKYEDVPTPEVSEDELLIRVKACSVNHLDIWTRKGVVERKLGFPHILGTDIAGETEDGHRVVVKPLVGCGKCKFCLAGRDNYCRLRTVLGVHVWGGYAEYVKVQKENVIELPDNLSFEQASCIPIAFVTAWNMLVNKVRISNGEKVLILGAGSNVGSAAIQIAKLFNTDVITTVGSEDKIDKAKSIGADHVINHKTQDIREEVKRITNGEGVDVVIEHVGSATWDKSMRSLGYGGRLAICGATTGEAGNINLRHLFYKQLTIYGSYGGSKEDLAKIVSLFSEGKLRAAIHKELSLKDAAEAHRIIEGSRHFGKIVLKT